MQDAESLRDENLRDAIAIIGLSGRFPQANDPETFWRNLREGKECITRFTDEELLAAGVPRALVEDPSYVKARPCLDRPEWFDADFFGYSEREAQWIDPQQRLFLECAYEALESAGYDAGRYPGWIGVFAGAKMNSYLLAHRRALLPKFESSEAMQLLLASDKDYLATRVSYKLDLKGPSISVQTACSTGLAAVHQACQSLRAVECDMAIAGAASVMFPERRGYFYEKGGPCSPDGRCRPFDAEAAGTVFGDAVGVVVLKRLDDAIEQGDFIHAILLGSATNNDGSAKVGYTAPSVDGQASVIVMAHEVAGVRPDTIDYVEAHGTGTSLGDPIEVRALEQAFRRAPGPLRRCALGSVKGNVGHSNTAAGIVGLIKTVLALRHAQIPATLHYRRPNPEIDFDSSPFYVNTELRAWPRDNGPRRAGVSSFGIGGANVHAVLQEGPAYRPTPAAESELLVLSARSEAALAQMRSRLADHLEGQQEISLRDAAFTLLEGRQRFNVRDFVVATSARDAIERLRRPGVGRGAPSAEAGVVMLFSGQGSQHPGMGRSLYEEHAVVRETVDECAERLRPLLGRDLRALLFDGPAEQLRETEIAQPALFVVEYAAARLLESWGVRPEALLGHSLGELVAACVAGVFSLEDGLRAVAARARLMQSLPRGAMLAVPLSEEAVLEGLPAELSLAAVNAPELCVVSGAEPAVARYEAKLGARGIKGRRLQTSHAFHSAATEPILREFGRVMAGITLRAPRIPLLSNVTGGWMTDVMARSAQYWADHLRRTVRFGDGVKAVLEGGRPLLFVEVGPGSTLCSLVRAELRGSPESAAVPLLPGPGDAAKGRRVLLEAIGELWARGADLRWRTVFPEARARRVPLPTYPFERRRYVVEDGPSQPSASAAETTSADDADAGGARLFRLRWSRLHDGPPVPEQANGAPWLLLTDTDEAAGALEALVRDAGAHVITVHPGAGFAASGPSAFVMRPDSEDDFRALLSTLDGQGIFPGRIVHLWSALRAAESCGETLRQGVLSVCALARSLGAAPRSTGVELAIVTRGAHAIAGETAPSPEHAALIGLGRSLGNEMPGVRCRVVDVILPREGEATTPWARALFRELAGEPEHDLVLLRAQQRWAAVFEAIPRSPGREASRLRRGGVYLITGAFGGIGLRLAEHLACAWSAKLVLMGRTPLPPRSEWASYRERDDARAAIAATVEALERLEAQGAEILIVTGDVAEPEDVARGFAEARARFGRIDGVFHGAGIPGAGPLQTRTDDEIFQVLSPKTTGTRNLAHQLAQEPAHPFLVLFSSAFSHLGAIGQADYAAANAYLDAFAGAYQGTTGNPSFAVAWDGWEQIGMAARAGLTRSGPLPPGPGSSRRGPHPLIDRVEGGASGPSSFIKRFSLARDWPVAEHRTQHAGLVSGTTLLEMARAAAALTTGMDAVALHDVRFHAPCRVEDGAPRDVCLTIERSGAQIEFAIVAPGPAGTTERLATGSWTPALGETRERAPVESIQGRCRPAAARQLFEAVNTTRLLQWGPRWDSIEALHVGDGEALAEIRLHPEFTADLSVYGLHPALLDVATAVTAVLEPRGVYLPAGYGRVVCLAPTPPRFFSHVRLRRDETEPGRELSADVTLLDEQGRVIVDVTRFVMQRVHGGAGAALSAPSRRASRGITPEDGMKAIERILALAGPEQIVVSPHDFPALAERQRRARLEPSTDPRPTLSDDERPRDEIERVLCSHWEELLGRRPIGIHDEFFSLGGHSLIAIQILSRIKEAFDVDLPKQDMFEGATVARLAEKITSALAERLAMLEPMTDGSAAPGEAP